MMRLAFLGMLLPGLVAAEELPVYPGTVHTRIGEELVIAGERYRVAYFTTRDPLRQVADWFFQDWRRRGFPTSVDGDGKDELVVSAFYTRQGLQRAVVLRTYGGRTLGFVVLKDLWSRVVESAPTAPRLDAELLRQDVVVRGESGNTTHRTAVLPLTLADARRRLASSFRDAGFRVLRERPGGEKGAPGVVLEHVRGELRVLTALTEMAPGLVAVHQSTVGAEGAARAEGGAR
ncbi:MAG TPA: hypothetical protein VK420_16365 [Longimicrobium sp.]|nr:hypothetical protein [Longimicrobium sp.]